MFIFTIVPLPLSRNNGDNNPHTRLAEIRTKINAAELRIRDLEALLTELILVEPHQQITNVSGVTYIVEDPEAIDDPNDTDDQGNPIEPGQRMTADAQVVRQALYSARAYEGELRTAEQFWNQIVQANKEAEKDTHELFKRG